MSNPFISICIPAYKRPDLFSKLLQSITVQTFRDFEVLVTDNSEDDSVHDVIAKFTGLIPIEYVKNVPGIGATQNCNKVIGLARAPWIKLMHDDDWFATPDALEKFANAAKNSGKDFIFCASNAVELSSGRSQQERLQGKRREMMDQSYYVLFYLNMVGHPSVVMHKKDPAIPYDEQFRWVQDIDFYLRFFSAHGPFEYIDEALVNIGKGSTQESNKYYKNPTVELPEYFQLLSKYPVDLPLKNHFVFHLVWNMVRRYRIRNIAGIRALGYDGVIPEGTDAIISCQKKVPRFFLKQTPSSRALMMRCFRNASQKLVM